MRSTLRAVAPKALAVLLAADVACTAACSDHSTSPAATPVPELRDEAGFFDVPPQAHGSPSPGRMFYAFEVADQAPAQKPLAVFLAGGPGYPASLALLPYGTARSTLDPSVSSSSPHANPASWTSFANVLFIDERQSGFSYEIDGADAGGCAFSPIDDAADAVHAVLRFLDGHPVLQGAPVLLVGQSYGGTRVTLMLDLLLRYTTEATRADAALLGEVQAHYDAVFPDHAGAAIDSALAATQFGRAVLLQPLLAGGVQYSAQSPLEASDPYVGNVPPDRDVYDVRQPQGWDQALDESAATALADLAGEPQLLPVDPRSIPLLGPPARASAFRVLAPPTAATLRVNTALTAALGPLGPSDRYLVYPSTACPVEGDALATGTGAGNEFIANLLGGVRTFISDARYDSVIYAPAIPAMLQEVATVALDTAPRPGVARPGWFTVRFPDAPAIEVRFPPYDDSGHFITVAEPQHLHDDVAAWMGAGP